MVTVCDCWLKQGHSSLKTYMTTTSGQSANAILLKFILLDLQDYLYINSQYKQKNTSTSYIATLIVGADQTTQLPMISRFSPSIYLASTNTSTMVTW